MNYDPMEKVNYDPMELMNACSMQERALTDYFKVRDQVIKCNLSSGTLNSKKFPRHYITSVNYLQMYCNVNKQMHNTI